jgi:hypothetical protein
VRIPIILTAALALSLSGAIIVIGAVNPSSQSSAPRIEIGYLAQTQSADEWEGAWSDLLAVLYEERQTKITMEAFGLVGWQGWQISENGTLTNGLCPGNMEPVESEGDIKIQRLNCFDTNGTLIGFYEERWKWEAGQTVYELSVELPPDWPWSTDRIAEERATIESDASFNGVPVVYPMYLQDEFLTTGKVLKVLEGGSWVYQPCATKICHENQSWHTVDTAAIAAQEQYWARFSAYCLAIADFNNRLKRLTETDPELAWDPTVYERYSFNQSNYGNSNTEWMCQLPQLPPTEADWQPHVIWTP